MASYRNRCPQCGTWVDRHHDADAEYNSNYNCCKRCGRVWEQAAGQPVAVVTTGDLGLHLGRVSDTLARAKAAVEAGA